MGKISMGRGDKPDRVLATVVSGPLIVPQFEIPKLIPEIVYVDREVPVYIDKEVVKYVDREVLVETIREVPVESIKEVIKYIDRDVERIVIKEVIHIEQSLKLRNDLRNTKKYLIRTQVALIIAVFLAVVGFTR